MHKRPEGIGSGHRHRSSAKKSVQIWRRMDRTHGDAGSYCAAGIRYLALCRNGRTDEKA